MSNDSDDDSSVGSITEEVLEEDYLPIVNPSQCGQQRQKVIGLEKKLATAKDTIEENEATIRELKFTLYKISTNKSTSSADREVSEDTLGSLGTIAHPPLL